MSQMIAVFYALLAATVSPTRTITSPPSLHATPYGARTHARTDHGPMRANQRVLGPTQPVTLILLDDFSQPGLAAFIRRTPGDTGADTIAVKAADLTPDLLVGALASLSRSRMHDGLHPSVQISMYINEGTRFPPLSDATRTLARGLVVRLRNASRRATADIGNVPTITIAASELNGLSG